MITVMKTVSVAPNKKLVWTAGSDHVKRTHKRQHMETQMGTINQGCGVGHAYVRKDVGVMERGKGDDDGKRRLC